MPSALIVSPDPQTTRLFELGLELRGWTVETAAQLPSTAVRQEADILLVDLADIDHEQWESCPTVRQRAEDPRTTVLILPRGLSPDHVPRECQLATMFVHRPFDFWNVVDQIDQLGRGKSTLPAG